MNYTSKILVAIAAGAAAGVVLGVLFAPDKGSETRKKINEQGKKIAGDVKGGLQKGKEKLNDLKESIGQIVKGKMDEYA